MEREEFESKLEECWKGFWEAIYTPDLNLGYWEPMFAEAYQTGFHKGFAFAFGEDYSDAVFEHRNLSQYSANCDNHIVQDQELVEHIAEARNMLRLKIAAQMAQGMLLVKDPDIYYRSPDGMMQVINKDPKSVAKVAFIFADALIAESQKGGAE